MKINQKILSIPPYISTSWKNVISLHIEEREGNFLLIIGLVNGSAIEIPNLDKPVLEAVFAAHQKYLEQETASSVPQKGPSPTPIFPGGMMPDSATMLSLPLNLGLDANMGNLLQHNSEASDSPNLPPEVLEKIATLSKVVGFENVQSFPKPEPHCNCMHCQIMRVIQNKEGMRLEHAEVEEEISEDDLRFREWDIEQSGDQLYVVSNPLNNEEHYNVFLGKPVGCTCGQLNCEHIRAVLSS
ncbi:MAG: hypothetical protein K1000chlam2_01529 [Chlamydiae bacterium]|nr:hypothetical protein [Chlamydiota bacterium]